MSWIDDERAFEALIETNEGILQQFKERGAKLDSPEEFEFICSFETPDQAREMRAAVRKHFDQCGHEFLDDGPMYVVCDYSKQAQPSELRLSGKMNIDVGTISGIETSLGALGRRLSLRDVSWEIVEKNEMKRGLAR